MKRIAFIDAAHHKETGSSKFIIDFLEPYFDIDIYWDKSKVGGANADLLSIGRENYDIIFIFQIGTNLNLYSQIDCQSIVCVPNIMLNDASISNYFPEKFKYLSLSKAQHKILSSLGRNSTWFQYYPNPYDFKPHRDYSHLKGFHWCRSPEVSPNMIYELMADTDFVSLHIHDAGMPNTCSLVPKEPHPNSLHVSYSKWLKDHKEYLNLLTQANVFFAPRLYEVTPQAILEAMSMGMCVVAPDLPSANEYIQNGENGLLYDPENPLPLNFSNAETIGKNARKSVELGFDQWLESRNEFFEYLTGTPPSKWDWSEALAPQFTLGQRSSETISVDSIHNRKGKEFFESGKRLDNYEKGTPLLTVATVVRDSEKNLEGTIKSVLGQTFDDFEYIVIDGMSSDGTIDIIHQYDNLLDYWISEKDEGPYQAMSKAVKLARGNYIVFMNAGDWFASAFVLERVFENLAERPDIIYGDHIWLNNGVANFHKSLPFSAIQGLMFKRKNMTSHWYHGLPNHQSTFIKTKLLRERPYDTKYKIAADYDFLFDIFQKGSTFLQINSLISVYQAGGMSSQNEQICHEEWEEIFSKYGNESIKKDSYRREEYYHFAQCVLSSGKHIREFFPVQGQTPIPSKFAERLTALAAVNECSKIYLTTPCLNAVDTIDQTISSVVSQCGNNFVLRYHIQDGGSTDGTIDRLKDWEKILSYSSQKKMSERWKNVIFSYSSEPDRGMYEAITRGFKFMEAPFTAILSWINADDILFQGAIATIVKIFRNYCQIQWVTGHNCLINYSGEVIGYNDEPKPNDYIRAGFCDGENWRYVQQEGTFFRKFLWDAAGGFDANLKYAADWDLWRRFSEKAELVHFPGPIAAFRLRRGQISATEIKKYMDEIDSIIPSADRIEVAKRLTAEAGKDLKIRTIWFRNNRFSLENKPLKNFRIPHQGRKLFEVDSVQDEEIKDSSPLNNSESSVGSASTQRFGLKRSKWLNAMILKKSGLFYERYYLDQASDIAKLKISPAIHYLLHGGWKGKDPNPMFSSSFYLKKYKDVYLSGINPLLHYIMHGWKEGRDPHPEFSSERYLIDNPDVKESGMNPLSHYLLYGILEGRKINPSRFSKQD